MTFTTVTRNIVAFARSGHAPSRRAWAALAKLHGRRMERRWPFLPKASGAELNLDFNDILEFEFARKSRLSLLVVGAYDGLSNDPLAGFIGSHDCEVTFVEPQPAVFARLKANMAHVPGCRFVNAAIDRVTGWRELFFVPEGLPGLPAWSGQLASFDRNHIVKHEAEAPGLSTQISSTLIETISFQDLVDRLGLTSIDVLQIDAEGMDAALLSWFPYQRMKPGVVHFEIAHMSTAVLENTRGRLRAEGYSLFPAHLDEIAVQC